jgi:hypothetical protein
MIRDYWIVGPVPASDRPGKLQLEDESKCCVDAANLIVTQVAHTGAQPPGIDGGGLFSKNPRQMAVNLNLRSKACLTR